MYKLPLLSSARPTGLLSLALVAGIPSFVPPPQPYMKKEIPEGKYRFTARVDMITNDTIWELKCTSQISVEHLLQVVKSLVPSTCLTI